MLHDPPKISRTSVDRAGRVLVDENANTEAIEAAWGVLTNWRSAHAFPLNTITMDLRQKVLRGYSSSLVVQRLKRTRSILGKLQKESSMRLTQMQDIGGCRAVLSSVDDVYRLRDMYLRSKSLHQLVGQDDYIAAPKASGYRGIHLIYRFESRNYPEYNKMLLEVQLRTSGQHAWATAVETVGAVLGQALKASEGERAWLEYFQNAAMALQFSEHSALLPPPISSKGDIARTLARLTKQLDVVNKLTAYRSALKATEKIDSKAAGYFLLVLLPDQPKLQILAFSRRNAEAAYKEYEKYERRLPLLARAGQLSLFPELSEYSGAQVVLVGAESFKSIRESYPNYYLDTSIFLQKVDRFVSRYKRAR